MDLDIVFNVDDNFVRHMCVTMLSILETNKDSKIHFHVLTYDLTQENREYISGIINNKCAEISYYDVNIGILKDFPIGKDTANPTLTYATYLRLLITDVLPSNLSKVLFLDCDIVVVNSLKELWNIDISNYYLAARSEFGISAENGMKRLNIDSKYGYFNAGVLLLNLDRIRNSDIFNKAKDYVTQHFKVIKFHDQDILNALFYDKRLELDERWNMRRETQDKQNNNIIHFYWKPWNIECNHPLKHLYYFYLSETKWAGIKPVNRYSFWQKVRMKLAIRTRLGLKK